MQIILYSTNTVHIHTLICNPKNLCYNGHCNIVRCVIVECSAITTDYYTLLGIYFFIRIHYILLVNKNMNNNIIGENLYSSFSFDVFLSMLAKKSPHISIMVFIRISIHLKYHQIKQILFILIYISLLDKYN